MSASGKKFIIDRQSDPVDFLSWLANSLHSDLTGGKRKKRSGGWLGARKQRAQRMLCIKRSALAHCSFFALRAFACC